MAGTNYYYATIAYVIVRVVNLDFSSLPGKCCYVVCLLHLGYRQSAACFRAFQSVTPQDKRPKDHWPRVRLPLFLPQSAYWPNPDAARLVVNDSIAKPPCNLP